MTPTAARPASPAAFFALTAVLSLPFWLLGSVTGAILLPGLPVSALMAFCPALAGLILAWRAGGLAGARALLARSVDFRRIRGPGWLALALLFMPAVALAAWLWKTAAGDPMPPPDLPWTAAPLLFLAFLAAALGEELGWSGYVLDPLRDRLGALNAALVIGLVWAAWHLFPFLQAGRAADWIAWQMLKTVAARLVMVWLYERGGRSVLALALFHAASNVSWMMFPNLGSHYDPRATGLLVLAAAAAIVLTGGLRARPRRGGGAADPPGGP